MSLGPLLRGKKLQSPHFVQLFGMFKENLRRQHDPKYSVFNTVLQRSTSCTRASLRLASQHTVGHDLALYNTDLCRGELRHM